MTALTVRFVVFNYFVPPQLILRIGTAARQNALQLRYFMPFITKVIASSE